MITQNKLEKHIEGFREYMKGKGHTPDTIRTYISMARNFLQTNAWGDKYLYQDILGYFEKLSRTSLSLGARKSTLSYMKKYYDFLLDTGIREDHPCRAMQIKGRPDRAVIHSDLFSQKELEPLIDHQLRGRPYRTCYQAIISLLIYQGVTAQELVRMKTEHIDLDEGTIYIPAGNTLTSRTLELKPRQYGILSTYLKDRKEWLHPKDDHLFISIRNTRLGKDSIMNYIEKFRDVFPGRELSATTIRKSAISHWLNVMKLPLEQVQLFAGHKLISDTERYKQENADEQMETLKQFHPFG